MDSKELDAKVKKLFRRLDVHSDALIIVREPNYLDAYYAKRYFEVFKNETMDGTLVIMGDCSFNENLSTNDCFPFSSPSERLVLSSGKMLQLLALVEDCIFCSHPSLMIGSVGKFSKYFGRTVSLDFPYGLDSVFSDFYDLNAVIFFIGDDFTPFEGKHAYRVEENVVIKKSVMIKDQKYNKALDIDVDFENIKRILFASGSLLYEEVANHKIYGIRYKDYIDQLTKVDCMESISNE